MNAKIERANVLIAEALDAHAAGFTSEAARKDVQGYKVSRAFEYGVHDAITNQMIDDRNAGVDGAMEGYYDVPHSPHQWRAKHAEQFGARFPEQVKLAGELVALRDAIKAAPLVAKKPTKTSIAKAARDAEAMTCQICGRPILAETGKIAHHGYERPGDGWQTPSCPGARALPFEVSRDVLGDYMVSVGNQIAAAKKELASVKAGKTPVVVIYTHYEHSKQRGYSIKSTRRLEVTAATFDAVKAEKPEAFNVHDGRSFADYLAIDVARRDRDIRNYVQHLKDQGKRFDGWKQTHKRKGKGWEKLAA